MNRSFSLLATLALAAVLLPIALAQAGQTTPAQQRSDFAAKRDATEHRPNGSAQHRTGSTRYSSTRTGARGKLGSRGYAEHVFRNGGEGWRQIRAEE